MVAAAIFVFNTWYQKLILTNGTLPHTSSCLLYPDTFFILKKGSKYTLCKNGNCITRNRMSKMSDTTKLQSCGLKTRRMAEI